MQKLKRIAFGSAATLCVAVFLLGAVFLLRSFKEYRLRARADESVIEINLADYFTFHWMQLPYGSELGDETVYRYQYMCDDTWHDYYTTSPLAAAPDSAWTAWKQVSAVSAVRSVALYRSDGFEPTVGVEFSALPSDCYSVSYEGDCIVSGTGEYTAKAVLELTNPSYRFVYEPHGVELNGRGMTVVIRADGTATVTKIWYVAYSENALLSPESEGEAAAYTLSSWTFGQFGGQKAPLLKRGDELLGKVVQPNGYSLSYDGLKLAEILNGQTIFYDEEYQNGSKDLLTFTLRREGEPEAVCENEPRSKWSHYFNDFMPVGSYDVTFTVQTLTVSSHIPWWNAEENFNTGSGGTEFRGFTAVYGFEVSPADFVLQDETLNQYGKTDAEPYQVELSAFRFGNYTDFFAPAVQQITFSGQLGRAEAILSNTYWGTVAEKYFDAMPRLTFRLSSADDGVYRSASADWSNAINSCGLYTVYYRAEMKNYYASFSVGEERYSHYFKVNVYSEPVNLSTSLRDESGNEIGVFVEGAQSGTKLDAKLVSVTADGFREKGLALAEAGLEARAVFEIVLKDGDEAVSPAGRVRAGITIPASLKDVENLQLALIDEKGEIHIFSCTEADGKYVFDTDGLGTLCFVTPLNSHAPAERKGNVGLIVAVCLAGAVAAAETAMLIVSGVKKRREKNAEKKN